MGLPFLGVPQLLVRFMATRNTTEVPKAAAVSIVVILLFDLGAVATGLVGRVLFPVMDDAENIMPTLAQELFPPLITGVLMVAVLSAVMSTVSSLLNLASSAIVHDLYKNISKRATSPLREARLGQWTTLVLGIAGCVIAMLQQGVIFTLVLFAWSGSGCSLRSGDIMRAALAQDDPPGGDCGHGDRIQHQYPVGCICQGLCIWPV